MIYEHVDKKPRVTPTKTLPGSLSFLEVGTKLINASSNNIKEKASSSRSEETNLTFQGLVQEDKVQEDKELELELNPEINPNFDSKYYEIFNNIFKICLDAEEKAEPGYINDNLDNGCHRITICKLNRKLKIPINKIIKLHDKKPFTYLCVRERYEYVSPSNINTTVYGPNGKMTSKIPLNIIQKNKSDFVFSITTEPPARWNIAVGPCVFGKSDSLKHISHHMDNDDKLEGFNVDYMRMLWYDDKLQLVTDDEDVMGKTYKLKVKEYVVVETLQILNNVFAANEI
jgi:hypothetical protein